MREKTKNKKNKKNKVGRTYIYIESNSFSWLDSSSNFAFTGARFSF